MSVYYMTFWKCLHFGVLTKFIGSFVKKSLGKPFSLLILVLGGCVFAFCRFKLTLTDVQRKLLASVKDVNLVCLWLNICLMLTQFDIRACSTTQTNLQQLLLSLCRGSGVWRGGSSRSNLFVRWPSSPSRSQSVDFSFERVASSSTWSAVFAFMRWPGSVSCAVKDSSHVLVLPCTSAISWWWQQSRWCCWLQFKRGSCSPSFSFSPLQGLASRLFFGR